MKVAIDNTKILELVEALEEALQQDRPSKTIVQSVAKSVAELEKAGLPVEQYPLGQLKKAAEAVQNGWWAVEELARVIEEQGANTEAVQKSLAKAKDAIIKSKQALSEQISPWLGSECSRLAQEFSKLVIGKLDAVLKQGAEADKAKDSEQAERCYRLAMELSEAAKEIIVEPYQHDFSELHATAREEFERIRALNLFLERQRALTLHMWSLFRRHGWIVKTAVALLGVTLIFFMGYGAGVRKVPSFQGISTAQTPVTPTSTASPTPTHTAVASPTPSATPTPAGSPTPTHTATASPTPSATLTPTPTAMPTPSGSPTPTHTAMASPTPSATQTPTATWTATVSPTVAPAVISQWTYLRKSPSDIEIGNVMVELPVGSTITVILENGSPKEEKGFTYITVEGLVDKKSLTLMPSTTDPEAELQAGKIVSGTVQIARDVLRLDGGIGATLNPRDDFTEFQITFLAVTDTSYSIQMRGWIRSTKYKLR